MRRVITFVFACISRHRKNDLKTASLDASALSLGICEKKFSLGVVVIPQRCSYLVEPPLHGTNDFRHVKPLKRSKN